MSVTGIFGQHVGGMKGKHARQINVERVQTMCEST